MMNSESSNLYHALFKAAESTDHQSARRQEVVKALVDHASHQAVVSALCELLDETLRYRRAVDEFNRFASETSSDYSPTSFSSLRSAAHRLSSSALRGQSFGDSSGSAPLIAGLGLLNDSTSSVPTRQQRGNSSDANVPALLTFFNRSTASVSAYPPSDSPPAMNHSFVPASSGPRTALDDSANSPRDRSLMNESATTFSRSAVVVKRGDTLDSVNDLEFVRPIGHGAQATVWLCVDVNTGEERAVKVIDRSNCAPCDTEYGMAEVEAAMRLQHDNVIRLYEVIDDPTAQAVFLVMEYVEDGASGCIIPDTNECETDLTMQDLGRVAMGCAYGLQYCHARGVVHGDIKPENILVSIMNPIRAVLADFGVAKLCAPQPVTNDAKAPTLPASLLPLLCSGDFGEEPQSQPHTPVVPLVNFTAFGIDSRLPMDIFDDIPDNVRARRRVSVERRPSVDLRTALSQVPSAQPSELPSPNTAAAVQLRSFGNHRLIAMPATAAPSHLPSPRAQVAGASVTPQHVDAVHAAAPLLPPRRTERRVTIMLVAEEAPPLAATASTGPSFEVDEEHTPEQQGSGPFETTTSATLIPMPSLKDVGRVLADRTRRLSCMYTTEAALQKNFLAKRGAKTVGGTPAFQAPELLQGGHPTPASDMWALGVTLFALLFKRLPWHGATWFDLKNAVCSTQPSFPVTSVADREVRRWRVVLERLLDKEPLTRMTAVELGAAVAAMSRSSSVSPSRLSNLSFPAAVRSS